MAVQPAEDFSLLPPLTSVGRLYHFIDFHGIGIGIFERQTIKGLRKQFTDFRFRKKLGIL